MPDRENCILRIKRWTAGIVPALLACALIQANYACAGDRGPAGGHPGHEGMQIHDRGIALLTDHAYYTSLISDLGRARQDIIIIMYLFKPTGHVSALPDHIVDMLIGKRRQGTDVTVILNIDQKSSLHGGADDVDRANMDAAKALEHKGIKVYFDSLHRITHAKVVVIDKSIVYIGSHNLTQSALRYNHEVSVRIVSPALAEELARYAEALKQER
ncbi:MAG: phospholipase D-like domain-containing protein [Deltaproteobacteria bacterium]|nr:phospholipase D-like domain-containing protein [Deltaproteobacteria bacterium]MCL5277771.1 phospholipase D-like domain-containing protein [Deltaproteobacteria bacterium]